MEPPWKNTNNSENCWKGAEVFSLCHTRGPSLRFTERINCITLFRPHEHVTDSYHRKKRQSQTAREYRVSVDFIEFKLERMISFRGPIQSDQFPAHGCNGLTRRSYENSVFSIGWGSTFGLSVKLGFIIFILYFIHLWTIKSAFRVWKSIDHE